MLNNKLFDSLIKTDRVNILEKLFGYFIGPSAVILMNKVLTNYLNVYYTDVLDLSRLWGGAFLSVFPLFAKFLDVLTFILMGWIVDRTSSRQGKARPWIFLSAPLLSICLILLFVVPVGNDLVTAVWIFTSYTVFYAVAFTMYSTAHTLMVPLATLDPAERVSLSSIAGAPEMVAGTLVAVLFPTFVLPRIGINRAGWLTVMLIVGVLSLPITWLEYFFSRERVTEDERASSRALPKSRASEGVSIKAQFKCCLKSRTWVVLVVFVLIYQIVNWLSSASTIYYCNWILGTYNDGKTQALYYVLGQFPLGLGIVLTTPLSKRFGRKRLMQYGLALATVGGIICLTNPGSLPVVLSGQLIRSIGLIPVTFMMPGFLGDALDDVKQKSDMRCDGFTSSVYNCIITMSGGIALFIFNLGLAHFGYLAPTSTTIPIQPEAVNRFIIFCVIGLLTVTYPVLLALFSFFKSDKKEVREVANNEENAGG